jgi:hypothetical protein
VTGSSERKGGAAVDVNSGLVNVKKIPIRDKPRREKTSKPIMNFSDDRRFKFWSPQHHNPPGSRPASTQSK